MIDPFIKSGNTSSCKMIVTSATAFHCSCFLMKTEVWNRYRMIVIANDGGKCEFTSDQDGLRAMRHTLNRMADEEKWDIDESR